MKGTLAQAWLDAVLRPRSRLGDHVRAGPKTVLLLMPVCAGILQSLMQAATNSVGLQVSTLQVFALAIPIGAAWGLLQLHLLSACLWTVARRDGRRLSFRMARHVMALATAPQATAFLAWVIGGVVLGRIAFVSPEAWDPNSTSMGTSLTMTMLYLGSAIAVFWTFVVLAFALREAMATSMPRAVGTIGLAGLVLLAVCFLGVVLFVAAAVMV